MIGIEETALRLALVLQRSGKQKGRVSESTLKLISERQRLRVGFLSQLQIYLNDLSIDFIQLDRGGFAIFNMSIFDGIPSLTAKKYLPKEERKTLSIEAIREELTINQEENLDSED